MYFRFFAQLKTLRLRCNPSIVDRVRATLWCDQAGYPFLRFVSADGCRAPAFEIVFHLSEYITPAFNAAVLWSAFGHPPLE